MAAWMAVLYDFDVELARQNLRRINQILRTNGPPFERWGQHTKLEKCRILLNRVAHFRAIIPHVYRDNYDRYMAIINPRIAVLAAGGHQPHQNAPPAQNQGDDDYDLLYK